MSSSAGLLLVAVFDVGFGLLLYLRPTVAVISTGEKGKEKQAQAKRLGLSLILGAPILVFLAFLW
jgi:hypothetical protein